MAIFFNRKSEEEKLKESIISEMILLIKLSIKVPDSLIKRVTNKRQFEEIKLSLEQANECLNSTNMRDTINKLEECKKLSDKILSNNLRYTNNSTLMILKKRDEKHIEIMKSSIKKLIAYSKELNALLAKMNN